MALIQRDSLLLHASWYGHSLETHLGCLSLFVCGREDGR